MAAPGGKSVERFLSELAPHVGAVLTGRMLAVDPASGGSSFMGWASFDAGRLTASGVVPTNANMPIDVRLTHTLTYLLKLTAAGVYDLGVVEQIRGKAHRSLVYSVGVAMAAISAPRVLELPIPLWKAHVGAGHTKSDEADAVAIGETVVALVKSGRVPRVKCRSK